MGAEWAQLPSCRSCPPSATLAARSLLAPCCCCCCCYSISRDQPAERVCPEQPGLLELGLGWLTCQTGRSEPAGRGREQGLSQPQPSQSFTLTSQKTGRPGDWGCRPGAGVSVCELQIAGSLRGWRACLRVQAWQGDVGGDWCESMFAQCAQAMLCAVSLCWFVRHGRGGTTACLCKHGGEDNKMTTVSDKELVCG